MGESREVDASGAPGRRVAICHADNDRSHAFSVAAALPAELSIGIGEVRTQASDGSPADDAVVIVVSHASHSDDGLRDQARRAADAAIPVVAVRVDPVEPGEGHTREMPVDRWVDVFIGGIDAHRGALVDAVRAALDTAPAEVADKVYDVFVCHSSTEALAAHALVEALEPELRCWIAPRDIPPGFSYAGGIMHGLDRSRMQVVMFSPRANSSPHVLREVNEMVSADRPVLTVRLIDTPMSEDLRYFLGVAQWFDAHHGDFADHLPSLRTAIGVRLSTAPPLGTVTPPAPAPVPARAPAATPVEPAPAPAGPDPAAVVAAADGAAVEAALAAAHQALSRATAPRDVVRAATALAGLLSDAARLAAATEAADRAAEAAEGLPDGDPDRLRAEIAVAGAVGNGAVPERSPSPRQAGDLVDRADSELGSDHPATLVAARVRVTALLLAGDRDAALRRARSLVNDIERVHRDEPVLRLAQRVRLAGDVFFTTTEAAEAAAAADLLGDVEAVTTGVEARHPLAIEARGLGALWATWPDPAPGRTAVDRAETVAGRRHPAYDRLLVTTLLATRTTGDHAAAADLAEALAESRAATRGRDDPATLWALETLSFQACDAGDHQRSLDASEVLLTRRRLSSGRASPLTLAAARWVAWELVDLDRPGEGVAVLEEALADVDAEPTHGTRLAAQEQLARYLFNGGRHADAAGLAQRTYTDAHTVRAAGDPHLLRVSRIWRDAVGAGGGSAAPAHAAVAEQVLATFDPDAADHDAVALLADLGPHLRALVAGSHTAEAEELSQTLWPVVAGRASEGDLDALDVGLNLTFLVADRGAEVTTGWSQEMWGRLKSLDPDVVLARWSGAGASLVARQCAVEGRVPSYVAQELITADRYLAGAPGPVEAACFPARAHLAHRLLSVRPKEAERIVAELLPRWGAVDMSDPSGQAATRALVAAAGADAVRTILPAWLRARGVEAGPVSGAVRIPPARAFVDDEDLADDLMGALVAQRDDAATIERALGALTTWAGQLTTTDGSPPRSLADITMPPDDDDSDVEVDLCLHVLGALAVGHLRRSWLTTMGLITGVDPAADRSYGGGLLTLAIYQYELVWGGAPDLASVGWIVTLREVARLLPDPLEELLDGIHRDHERAAVAAGRKTDRYAVGQPGMSTFVPPTGDVPPMGYVPPMGHGTPGGDPPPAEPTPSDLTLGQQLALGAAGWLDRRLGLDNGSGAAPPAGPSPTPPGQLETPPPGGWTMHPPSWPASFRALRSAVEKATADGSLFA